MRNNSIDNVRGLSMLVIISWHVMNIHSPWTDIWTMPVFFVIMGLFFKPVDWKTLVRKKTTTLVIPWLFFSLPDFIIKLVSKGPVYTIKVIVNPYEYIHAGSWFVACTLWVYFTAYCLHRIQNKQLRFTLTWVLIIGGFLLSNTYVLGHRVVLPLNFHSAICMYLFFEMGRLFRNVILESNYRKSICISCLSLCLCVVDINILGGVKQFDIIWVSWQQNEVLMVLRFLVGCATILTLCKLLPKIPIVSYMGRYSLIVLLSHFYFIAIADIWMNQLLVKYVAVVLMTLLFTWFSVKHIPYLVGVTTNKL